jgi:hypothetical protein
LFLYELDFVLAMSRCSIFFDESSFEFLLVQGSHGEVILLREDGEDVHELGSDGEVNPLGEDEEHGQEAGDNNNLQLIEVAVEST